MKLSIGNSRRLAALLVCVLVTPPMFAAPPPDPSAVAACPSHKLDDDGTCLPTNGEQIIPDAMRVRLYFRCERKFPNDGYVDASKNQQCCDHLTGALQDANKVCRGQPHGPFSKVNLKKIPWKDVVVILSTIATSSK